MKCIIPRLPSDSFDWLRWRNSDIWVRLGVACRYWDIVDQGDVLRYYAVGYREGEKLICRPKENETAVLFLIDNRFGWTHLRNHEFMEVFDARADRVLHTNQLKGGADKRGITDVAMRAYSDRKMQLSLRILPRAKRRHQRDYASEFGKRSR